MNILFVARAVNATLDYGDGVHVRELISAWLRQGHRVHLICLGETTSAPVKRLAQLGGKLTYTLVPTTGLLRFYPLRQLVAAKTAFEAAIRGESQVIYARPPVGLSGAFDVAPELFLSQLSGLPLVFEINGWAESDATAARVSRFHRLRPFGRRLVRWLLPRADGFVSVSESLSARVEEDLGVGPGRVRTVLNAANTDLFRPSDRHEARSRLRLPPQAPILVFVGHLGLETDLEPVIRAMPLLSEEFSELRLLVVGDGQDRPAYEGLVEGLGLTDRVRFTGIVPHEEVPLYINASDVCLVAIRADWISSPMKLFEYWACGKPAVATNLVDHEIIERLEAGVLVRLHTASGWAEAIARLLREPELARTMGERGRDYVVHKRTWEMVGEEISNYIHEVAGSPEPSRGD